jgi:predicted small lipoprotein YifL
MRHPSPPTLDGVFCATCGPFTSIRTPLRHRVLNTVVIRPVVALLLIGTLAACGAASVPKSLPPTNKVCSLTGCNSGAGVDIAAIPLQPGAKSLVTICIDSHCSTRRPETLPLFSAMVDAPYKNQRVVTVSIVMQGPDGRTLAKSRITSLLRRVQPNGPECPPVCFITRLKLTSSGQLQSA